MANVACQSGYLPLFQRASRMKVLMIQANADKTLIPVVLKDVGILQIKYKGYWWRHTHLRNLIFFPSYSIYYAVPLCSNSSIYLFSLLCDQYREIQKSIYTNKKAVISRSSLSSKILIIIPLCGAYRRYVHNGGHR